MTSTKLENAYDLFILQTIYSNGLILDQHISSLFCVKIHILNANDRRLVKGWK